MVGIGAQFLRLQPLTLDELEVHWEILLQNTKLGLVLWCVLLIPVIQEAEADSFLEGWGQLRLPSKFQASQGFKKKNGGRLCMVLCTVNPSTQEAETVAFLWVWGQSLLIASSRTTRFTQWNSVFSPPPSKKKKRWKEIKKAHQLGLYIAYNTLVYTHNDHSAW